MNENIDLTLDAEFLSDLDIYSAPFNHRKYLHIESKHKEILEGKSWFAFEFGLIGWTEKNTVLNHPITSDEEDPEIQEVNQYKKIFGNLPFNKFKEKPHLHYYFGGVGLRCDCCGAEINFWNKSKFSMCDKCEYSMKDYERSEFYVEL